MIEQIYRNASLGGRRALRYFVIGIGGVFAYDLFLFSHAEMLHGISEAAWTARGAVTALAVPFIAIAVRRNPDWSLDIFVSRQIVFYSSTFVAVGVYLVVMALGGYIVRDLGGTWGNVGQIMFLVGAVAVLATLVASSTLRRHATVFISKHFYRNKYDYRIEWLRFIETLSSTEEGDIRRTAVRAVAQIFSSPGAVLFTKEIGDRRFVPMIGWPMQVDRVPGIGPVDVDSDLIRFLSSKQWIIDINEYRATPDLYQNIRLPTWLLDVPHVRIVSPMLQLNELVGFFVLYEPPPPFELTFEDRDLLKTVGRHVATQLAQHEADRRLAESRQFEAYNRLTAFMMHDLKNSIAQLQLIVANATRHKSNPEFIDDSIATIDNTAERMTRLIEQISSDSAQLSLRQVSIDELVRTAVTRCSQRAPVPTFNAGASDAAVKGDPERLTAVIEHVIRNAQDASRETSTVNIETKVHGDEVTIAVIDTGRGMEPQFVRERLFRPFDSTKGSKGMGIGAYQTREYIQMLGGRVEVQSSPGSGTQFSITLPVALGDRLTSAAVNG
jgi:putative PEP-CTERM system histidine kinase